MKIKFDRETYLENAQKAFATQEPLEKLADKLAARGYSNLFFTGVGGTTAEFTSVTELVKKYSAVDVYCVSATEILVQGHKKLNRDSLVITGSKSGDTPETVDVTKYCVEKGIEVVAITGSDSNPLAQAATYNIVSDAKGVENTYLQFYYFVLKLLYHRGEFPDYAEFVEQTRAHISDVMIGCKEAFDEQAYQIAQKYHKEPYQIWVGSGVVWGDVYMFTMCILEEMQWIRTKAVSSSEFFHGTLELVDEDTPVFLVKGVDESRQLDERVERFLEQYAGKYEVIDLDAFETPGIDRKFKALLSPMMAETVTTGLLAAHLEQRTGHSLAFRRYYRQFSY